MAAFCAVTQARTRAVLPDVILEPAIGVGDALAELLLDRVAALRSPDRRSWRRWGGLRLGEGGGGEGEEQESGERGA